MDQLQLKDQNVLTSIEVAEMVEKDHKNLIRDIRQYCEYLGQVKIEPSDFFIESTYTNSQNKEQPCYLITRKGCDMVANKLTGAKGVVFTAKYVTRFEQMEQTLLQGISPELQAIIMQDRKLIQHDERIAYLENTKYIEPLQKKKITNKINEVVVTACGGKGTKAYEQLSKKLYSNINHMLFEKFKISQRAEILFIKYDEAFNFISSWYPNFDLAVQINEINEGK